VVIPGNGTARFAMPVIAVNTEQYLNQRYIMQQTRYPCRVGFKIRPSISPQILCLEGFLLGGCTKSSSLFCE
jgi:hypothetical protein